MVFIKRSSGLSPNSLPLKKGQDASWDLEKESSSYCCGSYSPCLPSVRCSDGHRRLYWAGLMDWYRPSQLVSTVLVPKIKSASSLSEPGALWSMAVFGSSAASGHLDKRHFLACRNCGKMSQSVSECSPSSLREHLSQDGRIRLLSKEVLKLVWLYDFLTEISPSLLSKQWLDASDSTILLTCCRF